VELESIIHALLKPGVEIFKTLPPLFAIKTSAEAFSATSSSIFVYGIATVESLFKFFFCVSRL
jgi:hypothetical protein